MSDNRQFYDHPDIDDNSSDDRDDFDEEGTPNTTPAWINESVTNTPARSIGGNRSTPSGNGNERTPLSTTNYVTLNGLPPVKRGCILWTFLLVNIITVISAISVLTAQISSIIFLPGLSIPACILRGYGCVFCLLVILCELEITETVKKNILVSSWCSRGIVYIFVGLLAFNEEEEEVVPSTFMNDYIRIAALGMSIIGALYFLMGIVCLRKVRDKRIAKYRVDKQNHEIQEALNQRAALNMAVDVDV